MRFDVVIIGGGPAGYTGAIRAAKLGMSVALIEKSEVGGTCLNRGCIPTKALLHSANLFASRNEWAQLGVNAENVSFDENKVYEHKDATVKTLRDGIMSLLKAGKIALYNGAAMIKDNHTVEVNGEAVEAENILIATGSVPSRPPIKGIENAITSDEILASPVAGEKMVIIGGGVIGMELASYYVAAGRQVTVIEAEERILPMLSKELSVQLGSVMKGRGLTVIASAKVTEILSNGVSYEKDGAVVSIDCDVAVIATGRRNNIQGLGLENAGVVFDRSIKVDDDMRTNVPNIYATGDVCGKIQLAHFAAASAITAVESMLGKAHSIDLSVVPSCVYTQPEIASVGNTSGETGKTGKFLLGANGKSLINGVNRGFVKVYCNENDVIVGADLFGSGVTELIGELALAVKHGLTAEDVASVIHAHPTVYESVAEACEDVFGLATHKR